MSQLKGSQRFEVALLSAAASERGGTTNAAIAHFILGHPGEVRSMGIVELARACSVGTGSVSRFCRDIGLRDFAELREILAQPDVAEQGPPEDGGFSTRAERLWRGAAERMARAAASLDESAVARLCADIASHENVAVFGLLKSAGVAANLQADLLLCGKRVVTHVSYAEQMRHLATAGPDDLMILFSYTGSYFDYGDVRGIREQLAHTKVWMVCGGKVALPPYVGDAVHFDSAGDRTGHPYQLQIIETIIAAEYARLSRGR